MNAKINNYLPVGVHLVSSQTVSRKFFALFSVREPDRPSAALERSNSDQKPNHQDLEGDLDDIVL
jgi:hypothetical protein